MFKEPLPNQETLSEYIEYNNVPEEHQILIEHHRPVNFTVPYHHHASIELNFLQGCSMSYSFSGSEVTIEPGHIVAFWAARPHRVIKVDGIGTITNVYVSLSQFLQWRLPASFVNTVLAGSVITTMHNSDLDRLLFQRFAIERQTNDSVLGELHNLEIESRLKRLAIEGWHTALRITNPNNPSVIGGNAIYHFERMLKFISEHYAVNISVQDVANHAGISKSYAIALFKKLLGRSIKEHLIDMRLIHAQMRLSETDDKILTIAIDSGFGSISSFYDVFHKRHKTSPAQFRKASLFENQTFV